MPRDARIYEHRSTDYELLQATKLSTDPQPTQNGAASHQHTEPSCFELRCQKYMMSKIRGRGRIHWCDEVCKCLEVRRSMKPSRCYEALGALDIYIAHAHMRACT